MKENPNDISSHTFRAFKQCCDPCGNEANIAIFLFIVFLAMSVTRHMPMALSLPVMTIFASHPQPSHRLHRQLCRHVSTRLNINLNTRNGCPLMPTIDNTRRCEVAAWSLHGRNKALAYVFTNLWDGMEIWSSLGVTDVSRMVFSWMRGSQ
ncbi:hypothetical protein BCR44DRAFT_1236826 [Catenaria anguillulae PL171]|uniref:Uncharacterized protein n=1 Tax=Catenaria anguillulae PL171 TaxID=765915 RepID=A0A1Y2HD90_9FUNG|nr:hypothetical protein BCR44DRAFT_1236826 [Catenaria anguillulae PL171]